MIYKVETIKDGTEKYFFIRNLETMSIEELPSKYLMHKIKCKRSPNEFYAQHTAIYGAERLLE